MTNLEILKTKNVQDSDERLHWFGLMYGLVDRFHKPVKEFAVYGLGKGVPGIGGLVGLEIDLDFLPIDDHCPSCKGLSQGLRLYTQKLGDNSQLCLFRKTE